MQASSSVAGGPLGDAGGSNDSGCGRARSIILVGSGATFVATTAVATYLGYLRMFTGFQNYDDEGFMLVALRSFISGHALYDKIFVPYGPFFFEFFGLVGALGVPFDNDSGRLVTLITFATAALTGEPMHPGGLVLLLILGIAAVALLGAGRWSGPWPFVVVGALAGAAILTKINVGGLAAISVAFACVLTFPALARRWPIRLIAAGGFVVVPFLLMKADLDLVLAQRFALHIGLCALALVVVTSTSRPDPDRRLSELVWLLAGGAGLAVVVLAIALVRGSSPNDLLNGIVLYPLNQRTAYEALLALPSTTIAWDALGLAGALLWTLYRLLARRPEVAIEGGVRVVAGLVIWVTVLSGLRIPGLFQLTSLNQPLLLPVALAWVVAAPRGRAGGFERLDFARALVGSLAILQALQAFPVAGSQTAWGALPLVPVGAICIGDGLLQLGLTRIRLQLAAGLVFLTFAAGWLPTTWKDSRAAYASGLPLGLPGASLVRVPADQATPLRQVTQSIRDNCDTFISIPGLDSFYIFGQLQPPIPLPTRYMWLIDDVPHQQALVEASKRINRLCVVENDFLIGSWSQGREHNGPLVTYVHDGFVPAYTFEHYSILVRPS